MDISAQAIIISFGTCNFPRIPNIKFGKFALALQHLFLCIFNRV